MKLRNKKTGEIAEIKLKLNESLPDAIRRTIEEAGWEETREPLIKDERIRKIVRAWAECCSFPIVEHYLSSGFSCFLCTVDGNDYCLDFNLRIDNLEASKLYTIAELCGEEKE